MIKDIPRIGPQGVEDTEAVVADSKIYSTLVQALSIREVGGQVEGELFNELNDVFKHFSSEDSGLLADLFEFEERGVIDRQDSLILFVLFSVSSTIGPYELRSIKDRIRLKDYNVERLLEDIDNLRIEFQIRDYLKQIIRKLQ
jgi:hypothetical protein